MKVKTINDAIIDQKDSGIGDKMIEASFWEIFNNSNVSAEEITTILDNLSTHNVLLYDKLVVAVMEIARDCGA